MLSRSLRIKFYAFTLFVALLFNFTSTFAIKNSPTKPTSKVAYLLADKFEDYQGVYIANEFVDTFEVKGQMVKPNETEPTPDIIATRRYINSRRQVFTVHLFLKPTPSAAYASLTKFMRNANQDDSTVLINFGQIGIADVITSSEVRFCKGSVLGIVKSVKDKSNDIESAKTLASLVTAKIPSEDANPPVLLEHLPDAETMKSKADYATSLYELELAIGRNEPALHTLSFGGGTEAVTAVYPNGARLVIAEHTTPQFAADAEEEINFEIGVLRASGQPVPSAFKRVGNYSVFVFDAPSEDAAKSLLEQVKYQKDVRWLGTNPHAYERAQRAYANMTAEMIITVLKSTGISVLLCLTVGGIFGGWIFMRRRARNTAFAAYSDAGGIVRLNIDEMTPQTDPTRLLPKGNK